MVPFQISVMRRSHEIRAHRHFHVLIDNRLVGVKNVVVLGTVQRERMRKYHKKIQKKWIIGAKKRKSKREKDVL